MNFIYQNKRINELSGLEKKKVINKIKLYKQLYLDGILSNTEIANKTDLSVPTVLGLLNELITDGFVVEQGLGTSNGGRRPNLYALKENSMYILAIDIGRYATRMAIFNNNNVNITEIKIYPIHLQNDFEVIDQIYNYAIELIRDSKIDIQNLMAIGIDMPGLVNSKHSITHNYLRIGDKSIQTIFEERFKLPVLLFNDANVRAFAEFRFGLAQGKKNVIVLHLGWGMGLGMILNGKLYNGTSGYAGEFSHIPFVDEGLLCFCGKRGCLETLVSGVAMVNMAKEGIKSGKISILNDIVNEDFDKIQTRLIVEAANKGDQYIIGIFSQIGIQLGKGIAILLQILNPDLVILGGRLAEARDYITIPIQQSLNKYCFPEIREDVSIEISELGDKACLLGTTALVMEYLLENPSAQ